MHYLRLACKKLAAAFSRPITGIFNRGDGLLWDLIECAGERTDRIAGRTRSLNRFSLRTTNSIITEVQLTATLRSALKDVKGTDKGCVIIVAHS